MPHFLLLLVQEALIAAHLRQATACTLGHHRLRCILGDHRQRQACNVCLLLN